MPLSKTPGHSQANLAQSLVGSQLLFPGSWCAQGFVYAHQESVSPVLRQFCYQIPLAVIVLIASPRFTLLQIASTIIWFLPHNSPHAGQYSIRREVPGNRGSGRRGWEGFCAREPYPPPGTRQRRGRCYGISGVPQVPRKHTNRPA